MGNHTLIITWSIWYNQSYAILWIHLDLVWSRVERVLGLGTERWRFSTENSPFLHSTYKVKKILSLSLPLYNGGWRWERRADLDGQMGLCLINLWGLRRERERVGRLGRWVEHSEQTLHDRLMMTTWRERERRFVYQFGSVNLQAALWSIL